MPLSLPLLNLQLGARFSTLLVTYLTYHVLILIFIKLTTKFVEIINPKKSNTVIGCLYKHPNMDVFDFKNNNLNQILGILSKEQKQVFLLGDFNINLLNYNEHQPTNDFLDSLASNSFIPYILYPTRITSHSKTLIDNIFSNYIFHEIISGNISATISDHLPQFSFVPNILPNPSTQKSNFYEKDWSKFKQENFILDYFDTDWADLLQIDQQNVNLSMDIFLNNMESILDTHAPLKKVNKWKLKFKTKPWITSALQKSILFKNNLLKKILTVKDPQIKEKYHKEYKDCRNLFSTILKQNKTNYFNYYFESNWSSIGNTWKGIKSIITVKDISADFHKSLSVDGATISNPLAISDIFNSYFYSIACKTKLTISFSHKHFSDFLKNRSNISFFVRPTDKSEIENIISSLDSNKLVGPNSIPIKILKLLKNDISSQLSEMFNISFSSSVFPSILKAVKVIHVHKKDSKLDFSNYRPFFHLSNVGKILEKLACNRIYKFFSENNLIYSLQSRFRQKYSTVHALINPTESIRKNLDGGNIGCGIFVDLQKAFDTVEHDILLSKLKHYGVHGLANEWFKSYLSNRKKYVSINGYHLNLADVKFDVPQGSVLSALLFLIYINDLNQALI